MSFQAMAWAVKQKVGNATGKAILLMLANYADERGECFPSQERLADECECSVATVARWVKAFEEMGFLSRHKQYGEGGYRRADRLRICTDLPVTKLPITELPSTKLPNSASKLTRQKAGAEPIIEPINTLSSASARKQFDYFWSQYPNKVGKPVAEKAFLKALKRSTFEEIISGLWRYIAKTDDRAWCNPSTFLNQDRWGDIPAEPPQKQSQNFSNKPPRSMGEAAVEDLKQNGHDGISPEFAQLLFGGERTGNQRFVDDAQVLTIEGERHGGN